MRVLHLSRKARDACHTLAPRGTPAREALGRVLGLLMDERVPLVAPEDRAITHGASVVGRPVPGTDLLVCYVPAGPEVHVIAVVRR